MTTKLAAAQQLIKTHADHTRALNSIEALIDMLGSNNARGLRLKANRPDGSQVVVKIEDLQPDMAEILSEALIVASGFHKDQLAEIEEEEDNGPQADPEYGPIDQAPIVQGAAEGPSVAPDGGPMPE